MSQQQEQWDEESPLLREHTEGSSSDGAEAADNEGSSLTKGGLAILLLGVFLVNSDSAVQWTLFRTIASEFGRLESASWIVNNYMMGVLVFMPLCGKLSDIFGRMPILAIMYACHATGAFLSGLGLSWWSTLFGRAIAGISNGGVAVLVSIIVVDVLPIRDVALWRSYVYLVNQLGRAAGPPLGGLIADWIDWRWALLAQVPFYVFSLIFVMWIMFRPTTKDDLKEHDTATSSWDLSKFRRIDFAGSFTIAISNIAMLLCLDRISKGSRLKGDPLTIISLVLWLVFFAAFLLIEAYWAREPILPLGLYVKPNIIAANVIQFMQTISQISLYSTIPLYFKIIGRDSSLNIAGSLMLITLGVIVGGMLSGYIIQRTGQYRPLIWVSLVVSSASYLVIFLRWRDGFHWAEAFYGTGAGFGFGVSLSASFICLNVGLDHSQVAVAASGFYLSLNVGSIVGLAFASLLITSGVRTLLVKLLAGQPNAEEIIRSVTSDLNNIERLPEALRLIVSEAYIRSVTNVWLLGFICGCLALLSSFLIPPGKLGDSEQRNQQSTSHDTFRDEEVPTSES